jgi:hypothetical protein
MSHTMLYRCPGPHAIHGGHFDYTIIPDAQIEETLAQGWFRTTPEAKEAYEDALAEAVLAAQQAADNKPATRDELEAKATELGIEFGPRMSDKKLREAIEAKLLAG